MVLNQKRPTPIVAKAASRAEDVTGSPDSNYSLYLDLTFNDGTHLWGQTSAFDTGTHDWQTREVVVFPEKPVTQCSFHMLLRGHGGKAWFRDPQLLVIRTPAGTCMFDGEGCFNPEYDDTDLTQIEESMRYWDGKSPTCAFQEI